MGPEHQRSANDSLNLSDPEETVGDPLESLSLLLEFPSGGFMSTTKGGGKVNVRRLRRGLGLSAWDFYPPRDDLVRTVSFGRSLNRNGSKDKAKKSRSLL